MRAFLIGIAVLLVGLVAAVLIGPSFLDWNGQKARIASEISRFTGRSLTIAGDMSLTLLPTPRLTATDVSLANIDGASTPDMADVDELEIQIDFWPLLRGRVQIESFALVRPQINLEVLADGRRNWDFALPFGGSGAAGAGGRLVDEDDRRLANQIKLEDFRIVDGRLVYRDPDGSQTIDKLDAEVSAGSLLGPFSLVGSGLWHGNDVRAVLNLGRLVKEGAATINMDVAFPGQSASLRFNGGILRDERRGLALRGQLSSSGGNLVGFVGALAPDLGPLPPILARGFAVTTELRLDRSELKATELSLRLDESQLEGSVDLSFAAPANVDIDLKATRLDFDSLLAGPPRSAGGQGPAAGGSGDKALPALASFLAGRFALPRKLAGHLKIDADSLVYRERLVRQLQLEADLAGGELTLSRASALLPGGSDVTLVGSLSTPGKEPQFDGQIETSSNNFRSLLEWLGADVSAVPANRLRRMSFASALVLAKGQLTAQGFDLQLDLTKARGGLAVALRKRLGFGLGMTLDSINLDAYMPSDEANAGPPDGETAAKDTAGGTGAAAVPEANLGRDVMALLSSFDANVDIAIGSATLNRIEVEGLHLDGTLREGDAVIREAQIKDFFGADVAYRGELRGLNGDLVLDGRFDLSGSSPNRLWKALTGEAWKYGETGDIAASGSLRGPLMAPHIEGSLNVYGGELSATGDLALATLSFDLALDAEHPSLPDLLAAMGVTPDLNPALGGGLLTGKLIGNLSSFRFEDLAGQLGATEFAGRLSYDGSLPRPYVEAELDSGPLAWPALFAAEGQEEGKLVGAEGPQSRSWSRTPLDSGWLEAFDGRLSLTSDALALIGFWLEEAKATAELKDGVLTLEDLSGRLFGGSFALKGQVAPAAVEGAGDGAGRARRSLQGRFSLQAAELDAQSLLDALFEVQAVTGKLALQGDFETAGKSEAQLIAGLAGSGRVDGRLSLALPKNDLGLGADAKRVQGVADGASAIEEAFIGAPILLSGGYSLRRGSLRTSDLRLQGRGATALTSGKLDIADWNIESRTDLYRETAPDRVYLSAKLTGPLSEPDLVISGSALEGDGAAGDPKSAGGENALEQ